MKRLLGLIAGCMILGLAGVPGLVFGQKQKDIVAPDRKEIPGLIADLKSNDAGKRTKAAQLLGAAGMVRAKDVADAVNTLLEMAQKDSDVGARREAAKAVGFSGPDPKKAVPILIGVLKDDKDLTVRAGAATALGYLGPDAKDAIPALQDAVNIGKNAAKDEKDKRDLGKAAGTALKTIQGKVK